MNRYIAEVIAAHVAIEHWLNQGKGAPKRCCIALARNLA